MSDSVELILRKLRDIGLGSIVYTPDQDAYAERNASYRSLSAQLKPGAIVQPRNTSEVAEVVKVIVAIPECRFAVRSGGRMAFPGGNNIDNGITIDLGLMASTTYNPDTQIASIQPGANWADAYNDLEKHGRMVAGGRMGSVGVGGFLLGGGLSFYSCRVGFSCDQVINYEVVLADGSIINANDEERSDLFRVLKGGGNNFGIVTRFDMVSFPARDLWDGSQMCSMEATPRTIDAFVDFGANMAKKPDSHVVAMWVQLPKSPQPIIITLLTNLDGEENASNLSKFLSIPEKPTMGLTTVGAKTVAAPGSPGRHETWATLTFKADARIMNKAASVYEKLIEEMKDKIPDQTFSMTMILQPLLPCFAEQSKARGGNMLGLDGLTEDCILMVWNTEVETAELRRTIGYPLLMEANDEVEAFARSVGGEVGFRFLNYSDGFQDPLASYGEENVRKMGEVAAKYDPDGVFQVRMPGGFKISKVTI